MSVLHPDMMSNVLSDSFGERRPNVTSAILCLKIGKKKIVYSSDATIEAWDVLKGCTKKTPIECDIMTIPHHGGCISNSRDNEIECQKHLYGSIITPKVGIISVGTSNTNNHPRKETIDVLKENKIKVFCTQITNKCCEQLEDIRKIPRVLTQPTTSKRDKDKTTGGNSRNVACFGTIVVEIEGDTIRFPKYIGQQLEDFKCVPSFRPMCG